ncbi:MAG: hypothetical protein MZV65_33310 [Chromatiales bacterium]|nr:hypothetical protein [Chromatiales bacterium]
MRVAADDPALAVPPPPPSPVADSGRRDATGAVRPIPPLRPPALDERAALRRSPASPARGPRPRDAPRSPLPSAA